MIELVFAISMSAAFAVEKLPSFDDFEIPVAIDIPESVSKDQIKAVYVFVPGSGPQNMDEDLSALTLPKGTKNLFFKDLAFELNKEKIAVLRFNKRSFEIKSKIEANPNYRGTEEYRTYNDHPLEIMIQDASHFVDHAQKTFPNARVFLLGHSEGTNVALQIMVKNKAVKGLALIGFFNEPLSALVLEQTVYRPIRQFNELDRNQDGFLVEGELKGKSEFGRLIVPQLAVLDLNKDGRLSLSEFKAGNYSNLVIQSIIPPGYLQDEAKLPRPADLVKGSEVPILFLQGEYDNQTPAYVIQGIQIANNLVWKKKNLNFVYFPKSGHALDPRDNEGDINYRLPLKGTWERVRQELAKLAQESRR